MGIFKKVNRIYKAFSDSQERNYIVFLALEEISKIVCPSLIFSEYGRTWMEDEVFLQEYKKFDKQNLHSADRKYFLYSLLSLVQNIEGDTVECGVFEGASSWLICKKNQDSNKKHYIFDSFEGLSKPLDIDGQYWHEGALSSREEKVKENLAPFLNNITIHKGWIPSRFHEIGNSRFSFVHIDVDLYQPTLDSLNFFYPKLVKGGIILCDDYGFSSCPGATKAFDEYMSNKPESIIHVPTGQGFIIKQ